MKTSRVRNNMQAHIRLLHYPDITGDWCLLVFFCLCHNLDASTPGITVRAAVLTECKQYSVVFVASRPLDIQLWL